MIYHSRCDSDGRFRWTLHDEVIYHLTASWCTERPIFISCSLQSLYLYSLWSSLWHLERICGHEWIFTANGSKQRSSRSSSWVFELAVYLMCPTVSLTDLFRNHLYRVSCHVTAYLEHDKRTNGPYVVGYLDLGYAVEWHYIYLRWPWEVFEGSGYNGGSAHVYQPALIHCWWDRSRCSYSADRSLGFILGNGNKGNVANGVRYVAIYVYSLTHPAGINGSGTTPGLKWVIEVTFAPWRKRIHHWGSLNWWLQFGSMVHMTW